MTMVRYCFNENRWTVLVCIFLHIILIIINAEEFFFFTKLCVFFYLNDNNTVKISTCIIYCSRIRIYYAT